MEKLPQLISEQFKKEFTIILGMNPKNWLKEIKGRRLINHYHFLKRCGYNIKPLEYVYDQFNIKS